MCNKQEKSMKKVVCLIALVVMFVGIPCFAAPHGHGGHGGHGGMRGPSGHGSRPAMHGSVSTGHHRSGGHGPSVGHRPPSHTRAHRPSTGGIHRPPNHHIGHGRPLPPPPAYRPYRPYLRPYNPYYSSLYYPYYSTYTYYPTTSYVYDPYLTTPVATTVNGVVVSDPYLKVNTAANVINAAANVATMVRYWTW